MCKRSLTHSFVKINLDCLVFQMHHCDMYTKNVSFLADCEVFQAVRAHVAHRRKQRSEQVSIILSTADNYSSNNDVIVFDSYWKVL